jgi:hypothetical protein
MQDSIGVRVFYFIFIYFILLFYLSVQFSPSFQKNISLTAQKKKPKRNKKEGDLRSNQSLCLSAKKKRREEKSKERTNKQTKQIFVLQRSYDMYMSNGYSFPAPELLQQSCIYVPSLHPPFSFQCSILSSLFVHSISFSPP